MKSVSSSNEAGWTSGEAEEAEELTASAGVVIVEAEGAVGRGVLEAKRTAARFSTKRFFMEDFEFGDVLASEGRFWEGRGLPLMGACCTVEEENWYG